MTWQRESAECDVFVSRMIYTPELDRPVPAQKFKERRPYCGWRQKSPTTCDAGTINVKGNVEEPPGNSDNSNKLWWNPSHPPRQVKHLNTLQKFRKLWTGRKDLSNVNEPYLRAIKCAILKIKRRNSFISLPIPTSDLRFRYKRSVPKRYLGFYFWGGNSTQYVGNIKFPL